MASKKVLQNRINKIIEKMKADPVCYPNVKITDDAYWNDDSPILTISTDYQIILFTIEDYENVSIKTRMRRGAGSEKDFTKKVKALNELRKYTKHNFKDGDYQVKETLDNIKITSADIIYTLIYDHDTSEVIVKTRARRGTKNAALANTNEDNRQVTGKLESTTDSKALGPSVVKKQITGKLKNISESTNKSTSSDKVNISKQTKSGPTLNDLAKNALQIKPIYNPSDSKEEFKITEDKIYPKIAEGSFVTNIYNNTKYKVVADKGNVIEVFSKDNGYLTMARSDLKIS